MITDDLNRLIKPGKKILMMIRTWSVMMTPDPIYFWNVFEILMR